MAFCKYCGKELPEGGVCSCEAAQAEARANAQPIEPMNADPVEPPVEPTQAPREEGSAELDPPPQAEPQQPPQTDPQPQAKSAGSQQTQQAAAAAGAAAAKAAAAAKTILPYCRTYFADPAKAVKGVTEGGNLELAVTLTVARLLAVGLALFGLLRKTCALALDTVKSFTSYFTADAGVRISAGFFSSLFFGALMALIGSALFVVLVFALVKLQKGEVSLKSVFLANAANGVFPTALFFLSFLCSFFSLPLALGLLAVAVLAWVICGVLTAQLLCPAPRNGLFWLCYIAGTALLLLLCSKVMPDLFLRAAGSISITAGKETVKLSAAIEEMKSSLGTNLAGLLQQLLRQFMYSI